MIALPVTTLTEIDEVTLRGWRVPHHNFISPRPRIAVGTWATVIPRSNVGAGTNPFQATKGTATPCTMLPVRTDTHCNACSTKGLSSWHTTKLRYLPQCYLVHPAISRGSSRLGTGNNNTTAGTANHPPRALSSPSYEEPVKYHAPSYLFLTTSTPIPRARSVNDLLRAKSSSVGGNSLHTSSGYNTCRSRNNLGMFTMLPHDSASPANCDMGDGITSDRQAALQGLISTLMKVARDAKAIRYSL